MEVVRFGVCRKCGKKFIEISEDFDSIESYWIPKLCQQCRKKEKKKKK